MQQLITEKVARQVTGGRKPLVPIEYERAVKDLALCQTIDEAIYFSDKADALAAWAKIYKNDEAGLEARKLKLHAFRRAGLLAEELRPKSYGPIKGQSGLHGRQPGALSLLVENGLNLHTAEAATKVARMPEKEFLRTINLPRPPSPIMLRGYPKSGTESYKAFSSTDANSPIRFRTWIRSKDAKSLAKGMSSDEAIVARKVIAEIQEWLDEFERHMPKTKTVQRK